MSCPIMFFHTWEVSLDRTPVCGCGFAATAAAAAVAAAAAAAARSFSRRHFGVYKKYPENFDIGNLFFLQLCGENDGNQVNN